MDVSQVEADHVVPLRFAWEHGARTWTDDRRREFANDPRNILIVEASLNRRGRGILSTGFPRPGSVGTLRGSSGWCASMTWISLPQGGPDTLNW
nr:DUF1524 domain-containing protein [Marinobacter sp. tcs-11]